MTDFKIGFIGLGLIGGSVAKSIRRIFPDYTITAMDNDRATLETALNDGTLNSYTDSILDIADCNYIFLCAPVHYNIEYLKQLKPYLTDDTILSDVGSVKLDIYTAVNELGLGKYFVGGHPMVGSERSGYDAASDRLIENAYYFITPSDTVPSEKAEEFMTFIGDLGAIPICYSPAEHDRITSYISHVPHVIAASLVNLVKNADTPDGIFKSLAAGGFKDITRIASSNPVVWEHILLSNPDNIINGLKEYIELIKKMIYDIEQQNSDNIRSFFDSSRSYRDSIPNNTSGVIRMHHELFVDIPDEPGALAKVTVALANADINLKNFGVSHNREDEEGVLRLSFYDNEAREKAQAILSEANYKIYNR
ncbi:MAG: prephenate dehydrogenase/arogenate dehydrogenase family protein [Coprococcus sp.]